VKGMSEVRVREPEPEPEPSDASESESGDWEVGDWFRPTPSRPLHGVRCDSVSHSTGERCKRWSTLGARKCAKHGGLRGLPNVQAYRTKVLEDARLQLLAASGEAVDRLIELRDDPNVPAAVRLKASSEILDRAGIHRGTEITVSGPAQPEVSASEIIRGRLQRLAAASRQDSPEEQVPDSEADEGGHRPLIETAGHKPDLSDDEGRH